MSPAKKSVPRSKRLTPVHFEPRFCSQCGYRLKIKFIIEERCNRLFCGKCESITYLNPRVVAGAIPLRKGKIVLLRRGIPPMKGYWTFPAGYVEIGETVWRAAIREAKEETRITIDPHKLLGVYSYKFGGVAVVVYEAKVTGGRARATPEALEVREFHPSDIPWDELAFQSTRDALKDWIGLLRKRR